MGKKKQFSISMDVDFMAELREFIEIHRLGSLSSFIQEWSRVGFKDVKNRLGKREIAPEISKP